MNMHGPQISLLVGLRFSGPPFMTTFDNIMYHFNGKECQKLPNNACVCG